MTRRASCSEVSINTDRAQKPFFSNGRKGKAPHPACLRRKMLQVILVGSFYSFLPITCWANSAMFLFHVTKLSGSGTTVEQERVESI